MARKRESKTNISAYVDAKIHNDIRVRMTQLGVTWEFVLNQSLSMWLESTTGAATYDERIASIEAKLATIQTFLATHGIIK